MLKLLAVPKEKVVAEGRLIKTGSNKVHGKTLAKDQSRISIMVAIEPFAALPVTVPDADMATVGDALNSIVAWPNALIVNNNKPVIA